MDHVDKTSFKSGCLDEKAQKSGMINISEKVAEKLNDNSQKVPQ